MATAAAYVDANARRDMYERTKALWVSKSLDVRELDEQFSEEERSCNVRKLVLETLFLANVQLAQIVKAMGPNTYCSTACSSTSSALRLACNVIELDQADRMLVISSDAVVTSHASRPIVESFLQLGAAGRYTDEYDISQPFTSQRQGFVFGEGAVALLLAHPKTGVPADTERTELNMPARSAINVLSVRSGNSAFHGTRMDANHISHLIRESLLEVVSKEGCTLEWLVTNSVYVSHETCTKLCANAEIDALEQVLGRSLLRKLPLTNIKHLTGHCMGVAVEDCFAVFALCEQRMPVISSMDVAEEFADLTFTRNTSAPLRYTWHLACGMGSQVAFVVYGRDEISFSTSTLDGTTDSVLAVNK